MASRGPLRPLSGSGFALGQPDAFGAGAFPFRLMLRAAEPRINSHSPFPGFCLRRPNTEFLSHRVTEGALELARFARSPANNGDRGEAAYKTNLGN